MREIKFRAWDGKRYHCDDFMIRNGNVYCFGEFSRETLHLMDWSLEQYTGLKDIYENDIIQDNIGIGVVEYKSEYAGFRVNYKNGRCKWFYDYLESEMKTIEIIGNTHETPELLK